MSQRRSKRIIMGVGTVTRLSQHSNAGYLPGVHFTNVWDSAPAKKRIWRCTGNSQMLCTINIFWMGQAIILRDINTYKSPRSSFVAVHTSPISENWIYRYWKPNYRYLLLELPISVNHFYLPISVNKLFSNASRVHFYIDNTIGDKVSIMMTILGFRRELLNEAHDYMFGIIENYHCWRFHGSWALCAPSEL